MNGAAVFSSSATLNGGIGGQVLNQSGTPIANSGIVPISFNIWEVAFDDLAGLANLGTFAPGESFDFEIYVSAASSAFGFELGASASVGDPGDITGSGGVGGRIIPSIPGAAPVPAPATIALLAVGLLCVRRRTQRS